MQKKNPLTVFKLPASSPSFQPQIARKLIILSFLLFYLPISMGFILYTLIFYFQKLSTLVFGYLEDLHYLERFYFLFRSINAVADARKLNILPF